MSDQMTRTIAGWLPADWDAALIKTRCNVVRGASPRPAGDPRFFDGDYLPWITVADVTGISSVYLTSTRSKLTQEGSKHTRIVPAGTLIISNSGATLGVPRITAIPAGANDGIAMFLEPQGLLKEFMYFFLESKTEFFRSDLAPGVGQPNLNTDLIGGVSIPVPPVEEQSRIAELLTQWNSAIEKTERLIAAKENYLKAIEHQLLTARKRLNGFSKNWESIRADKIFESVSLKGFGSEPLLSVTQDQGVIPRDTLTGRVTMPSGETTSFKLVEPGNFVISLRSFQGGLEHSEYRGLVSPAYTVLRATREIDVRFFRHYFRSADFIKRLSVAVIGIRDGKQVSFQDFCSIKLPFPPIAEQKAIAAVLDEGERELALLRDQSSNFKKQKRGLMQKLLTGQWRLRATETEAR